MLNKLSFNLAKELNESETRKFKIKKKVFMESTRVKIEELEPNKKDSNKLTEGAGAGYHITGTIDDSTVNSFNVVETTEDKYGTPTYLLDCDISATLEDVVFESYYDGGKVDSAQIQITKLCLTDNHDPEEKGELNNDNIKQSLDSTQVKSLIGAGWIHSTFDGNIEYEEDNADGSVYSDFYVLGVEYHFIDEELVKFIDLAVQGENITEEYIVYAEDYDELDRFDSEEEAIEYAKNTPNAVRVEQYSWRYNFDGDIDFDSEYSETVWEKDDMEESEKPLKEDDYSLARPWSTALINYCENYGVDIWEDMLISLINYLPDDTIGNFLKSENPNGISKPEDFYPGEIDESSLNEKYSEKLGGDSEDFVSDVNTIKSTLESIDTDSFGTHLAQQMVWDWIETCDYQIDRGNRLTKGEFNECDKPLKEGFSTNKVQIVDTCERRGQPIALVNLSQIKPWEEYVVAFGYTTENNEISWDYGYYYYDEESAKEAFEKVKAGGYLAESEKTEKKPIVEAAETEVKDLQVIKEQGNIYMLEDKSEGTRYIVGENYNLSEGEIENAEIYDNKEEADKDYLDRCDIIKTEEESKEDTVTEAEEINDNLSVSEKIQNLKYMDEVMHHLNDEDYIEGWLMNGVPDGATEEDYKDIAESNDDEYETDYKGMLKLFKKILHRVMNDDEQDKNCILYNCNNKAFEFAKQFEPEVTNEIDDHYNDYNHMID